MTTPGPRRILFVGNSFTYCKPDASSGNTADNDLPGSVQEMANRANLPLDARAVAVDDETLQGHWEKGTLSAQLRTGPWDCVVLQEHSQRPLLNKDLMFQYAQKLDAIIKAAGARTFLFSTWAWRDHPQTQAPINAAYAELGLKLDAPVVPVGQAWRAARDKKIELHLEDGVHPNPSGAHLSACVFFSFLFGMKPAAHLELLEKIAWDNVHETRS